MLTGMSQIITAERQCIGPELTGPQYWLQAWLMPLLSVWWYIHFR